MRISDWSSDVCSSDLGEANPVRPLGGKEFLADLHAADRAGQQLGESRSLVDLRGVEADEDALVGQWGRGHGLSSLRVKLWWRPSAHRRKSLKASAPVAVRASCCPIRRSEEQTSELQSLMRT